MCLTEGQDAGSYSAQTLQVNREALQKRELERQADTRAKQQELAIALQVSALCWQPSAFCSPLAPNQNHLLALRLLSHHVPQPRILPQAVLSMPRRAIRRCEPGLQLRPSARRMCCA